jgi:hypothetical protein
MPQETLHAYHAFLPAPRPDFNDELGVLFEEPTRHPVTVVRLSCTATAVSTPGGSFISCHVGNDRPLPVSAVMGRVSLMEHNATPCVPVTVVDLLPAWARKMVPGEENPESFVFNLYPESAEDGGWGDDEDDQRIFDQATGLDSALCGM